MQHFTVPLSRLVSSKRNPRRVKPDRDAHRRLVALIKTHGLLQPLVVRPADGKAKDFVVIAGNRRLAALHDVHRNDGDPRIPCVLRKVDAETADALSLGENFGQEPMHPLDEAEAFAKLASQDGKDAPAIAAEFGVTDRYVRQRMKLATLAEPIKRAYREGTLDTATAEAFAAVPEDRQLEVWKEVDGRPRHAEHVRNVIANDWIDATLAIFDTKALPEGVVSQDLFSERVLIERKAFLEAQANALQAQQKALTEDGWSEVVVGRREDVQDRLLSMDSLQKEFDAETTRKLKKIDADRQKLQKAAEKIDDSDEARIEKLQERFDALDEKEREIESSASACFSEATKARATMFLMLGPNGQVHREYRVARKTGKATAEGRRNGSDGTDASPSEPKPPTSDDLSDRQLAVTFTHQAVCVREALSKNALARKRVLALLLHEKVRSEALAIRHDANGTTLHASTGDEFKSAAFDRLKANRSKLDPFLKVHFVEDVKGYELLAPMTEKKLDALIDVLVVDLLTTHMYRPTALIARLAEELKVNVRNDWKPDGSWLSGYQKIQLVHLVTELKGVVHAPAPERKKSDLVGELAGHFAQASDGKLEDKSLAERLNVWLPANLRQAEHVK